MISMTNDWLTALCSKINYLDPRFDSILLLNVAIPSNVTAELLPHGARNTMCQLRKSSRRLC